MPKDISIDRHFAISGFPGSGKSTVGRRLAKFYRMRYASAGSFMRNFAQERGIDIERIGDVAETGRDLDQFIDDNIQQLSNDENRQFVFDSRMAWHFVPGSLKIHLEVSPNEAAIRAISRPGSNEESYSSLARAKAALERRRDSEVKRYQKYYGVQIDDFSNYNLILFTDNLSANDVYRAILQNVTKEIHPTRFFASPLSLIPTQSIRHLDEDGIRNGKYDYKRRVELICHEKELFIADGHNRVATALLDGVPFIEFFIRDMDAIALDTHALVEHPHLNTFINDWEDSFGIRLSPARFHGRIK